MSRSLSKKCQVKSVNFLGTVSREGRELIRAYFADSVASGKALTFHGVLEGPEDRLVWDPEVEAVDEDNVEVDARTQTR